jgi:hypothetical protein
MSQVDRSMSVYHTPLRLEISHRFLAACRIASIRSRLRHPRRDRPEPAAIFWRRMRPHDAADVLVAVEHVVVVVRPLAARAGFGCAFGLAVRPWRERPRAEGLALRLCVVGRVMLHKLNDGGHVRKVKSGHDAV